MKAIRNQQITCINKTYCSNGRKRTLNSARRTHYGGASSKASFGRMHQSSNSKFSTTITARPPFKPAGFQQARDEIADKGNFLLCREYYLREKELNFENFQKSKSMWKGDSLLTTRKQKPVELPKSKRKFLSKDKNDFLNGKNSYQTYLTNDAKRLQILSNYKEINRIITKNFIKKRDPGFDMIHQEEEHYREKVILIAHVLE